MSDEAPDTTRMLRSVADGVPGSAERLLPVVYGELRALAERMMQGQPRGHTLQPTALIHEAYLRLVDSDESAQWDGRVHFVRVAARAMRFALVDHARARGAHKRGGRRGKITLGDDQAGVSTDADFVLDVHDALERLQEVDEQLARIVELRYFGGLDNEEVARAIGVTSRTVRRGWRLAQAWLLRAIEGDAGDP